MSRLKVILISILLSIGFGSNLLQAYDRPLNRQLALEELPYLLEIAPGSLARFFAVPMGVESFGKGTPTLSTAKIHLSLRGISILAVSVDPNQNLIVKYQPVYWENELFWPYIAAPGVRMIPTATDSELNLFLADAFAPAELKSIARTLFQCRLHLTGD